MNDELLLNNYLLVLKSTVEVYVHGTLESSNGDVREILKDGLNQTMINQASTYDQMTNYGWYKVNCVKASDITKIIKKLNSKE